MKWSPVPRTKRPGGRTDRRPDLVPFGEAARAWFVISLQTFGGPAGQIAVMQRTLVEEKRWIGHRRFLHALNYCMLLPGPEAQQLAIYTGWLLNGTRGGLVAGTLFVLPGMLAMLVLSALYVGLGDTGLVSAVFAGLAPAVIAIVVQAVVRVGRRALTHSSLVLLAVASFVALSVLAVPFPVGVAGAAVAGWLLGRWIPGLAEPPAESATESALPLVSDDALHHDRPSGRRALAIVSVAGALWAAPVVAAMLLASPQSVYVEQGLFFSGVALVTFGGAYAVLSYVAQQAVEVYGWLATGGDGARPGVGRDHPGAADHGRAVRRVRRGLP